MSVSFTVYSFEASLTLIAFLSTYSPVFVFCSKSFPNQYVTVKSAPSVTVNERPSRSSWVTGPSIVLLIVMYPVTGIGVGVGVSEGVGIGVFFTKSSKRTSSSFPVPLPGLYLLFVPLTSVETIFPSSILKLISVATVNVPSVESGTSVS